MNTLKTILIIVLMLWAVVITTVCINQHGRIEAMGRTNDVVCQSIATLGRVIGEDKAAN